MNTLDDKLSTNDVPVKISVAIPLYNRKHFISDTLNSIFSQSYPVDEVVIVDDGSTDSPLDVLQHYLDRVRYIRIENSGPAYARKIAIENCANKWIALCDSDDLWLENHTSDFVQALTSVNGFSFYFCDFILSDTKSSKMAEAPSDFLNSMALHVNENFYKTTRGLFSSILKFQCIFQSALIFDRQFYESIGGIDSTISRVGSEDLHLTMRFVEQGIAVYNNKANVVIRKHEGNFSSDYTKVLLGEIFILELLLQQRTDIDPNFRINLEASIAERKYNYFKHAYWNLSNKEAFDAFNFSQLKYFSFKDYLRLAIILLKRLKKI
jgi:glycosyltransferase involved in cell wall biosynthesis